MKFLTNIFWFFLFLPFVSPLPLNTDAQPICGALGLVLIFRSKKLGKLAVPFAFCLISGFLFTLFFYLQHPFVDPFDSFIRKGSSLLLGFVTYLAVYRVRHSLSLNNLFIASSAYTFFAGLFLLNPTLAGQIQNNIVRTTKLNSDSFFSYRGVPILASEPSFSACSVFVILLITLFCQYKLSTGFQFKRSLIVVFSVFSILSTKSGSGYLLLVLLSLYIIFTKLPLFVKSLNLRVNRKILLLIILSMLVFLFALATNFSYNLSTNRGLSLLNALIQDRDSLSTLTAPNASLGLRINLFIEQLNFWAHQPLWGYGFQGSACFNGIFSGCSKQSIISTFMYFSLAIGILFPITIFLLFKSSAQNFFIKFTSFGFLCFSLSYAFTGPWVLLALRPNSRGD